MKYSFELQVGPGGDINPLNVELNPICHLLALAGAHHFVDVSRIRVKVHFKEKYKQLYAACLRNFTLFCAYMNLISKGRKTIGTGKMWFVCKF
jgi:hypothetical protein